MPVMPDFYPLEPLEVELSELPGEGWILDIGGGGEGVIGRLAGTRVVAIDIHKDELEEAPPGPLKIVMDARGLTFLDDTFETATMCFSLMYMKNETQRQVFAEAFRVLKPGGSLHVWDIGIAQKPITDMEYYAAPVLYRIRGETVSTGYGQTWPAEVRDEASYIAMAQAAGFAHVRTERNKYAFYMVFQKPLKK